MDVYEVLEGPNRLRSLIKSKKEKRLELIMSLFPGAIRYDKDKVQTAPSDKMSDIMASVDDLDNEIAELREELREARRTIEALPLPEQELRVICLRYEDGLTWEDVARAVHKSRSTVHRIHKSAVDKLKIHNIL